MICSTSGKQLNAKQVDIMQIKQMSPLKKIALNTIKTLALPFLVYIVFFILAPNNFGTPFGIYVSLMQTVTPTLIGWGICLNLLVGAWDFSAGAVVSLAAVLAAYASLEYGLIGIIVVCMLAALVMEVLTGAIFTLLRIPSIITTIGMMLIYESVTQLYRGGSNTTISKSSAVLSTFPYIFIVLIFAGFLFYMIYEHSKIGYDVRAVGNGANVAKNIGINPRKVKFLTFVVAALFIGIAAIMHLSYGGTVGPKANMDTLNLTFTPIMGVVLGIALSEFCGLAIGVVVGEFTLNLITSGLVAMGLSGNMQKIITGVALLCVLILTSSREQISINKAKKTLAAEIAKSETT